MLITDCKTRRRPAGGRNPQGCCKILPMNRRLSWFRRLSGLITVFAVLLAGVQQAAPSESDVVDQARAYTRAWEFDYVSWTLGALAARAGDAALPASRWMDEQTQKQIVVTWLGLSAEVSRLSAAINHIYSDPEIADPSQAARDLRARRDKLIVLQEKLGVYVEAVLEGQISQVVEDEKLASGGQVLPPLLFRTTPLPYVLVLSPRERIERLGDISLDPGVALETRVAMEQNVESSGNLSALAVAIGGVGVYPTMVMGTTDLNWLVETVAHEWVHNYLTLRPLGIRYDLTPELRTMNETTASIAGREIGEEVIRRYYPERMPAKEEPMADEGAGGEESARFNFRAEMHTTRVHADELLAQGRIEEAEAYMESRRVYFWENGYQIRRLNQAYFAFYGAYNDVPGGGAAGRDPVGPAVQLLRERADSLAAFLNTISRMRSFKDLQDSLAGN